MFSGSGGGSHGGGEPHTSRHFEPTQISLPGASSSRDGGGGLIGALAAILASFFGLFSRKDNKTRRRRTPRGRRS
jgi:hypothetical protein